MGPSPVRSRVPKADLYAARGGSASPKRWTRHIALAKFWCTQDGSAPLRTHRHKPRVMDIAESIIGPAEGRTRSLHPSSALRIKLFGSMASSLEP
jgi:hypothetical protein